MKRTAEDKKAPTTRCAIYTRKSTEEGLEQEFNSLDAQRESAEAYIASQRHEGWTCLPTRYDDGGFTGGNMDRPALQRLLADIEAGKVDCIVVYKVDRLTAFLELCEGVQAIHAAGMVHRDIKPDNALIIDGRVVVADLGLAKFIDRDTTILTQTQAVVGTEMYLAPEQRFSGGSRDADGRTDIYQLGKTLYQFLTNLEPAIMDMSKVPPGLAFAIRKATKENPNERYQTIGQLIDAVKTYQKARDPNANPASAFEALINRIKDRLERGEYREEDLGQLLSLLMLPIVRESDSELLAMFDRVPLKVLAVLPETHSEPLDEFLRVYVAAVEQDIGGRDFSYAEAVAKRMVTIFGSTGATAEIKSLCVEATLIAAVSRNRFAAMDTLNSMLTAVNDEADAMAVREALERQRSAYRGVCEQIPAVKLHATIRSLREELLEDAEN